MSETESPPSKPDEETAGNGTKKALDRQKGKQLSNLHTTQSNLEFF